MAADKSSWSNREQNNRGKPGTIGGDEGVADFGFQKVPVREKANRVRNHFDTVAEKYDMMNTLLSFGIHYLWKRKAAGLLRLKPGERVIDVCGGTGDLSILALRKVGSTGQVIVYDINRKMMVTGKHKGTNAGARQRIQFIQGDAEQIAFASASFDAAMVGFGIRNVTRMEEGFREMYRVLKPGGRFMCLEFSKPVFAPFRALYDFYSFVIMPLVGVLFVGSRKAYTYLPESIRLFPSPDELSGLLREIGFHDVSYTRLSNGIAVIHRGVKQ
jgi:demethylmenaquinone methyltransferase / 2-methoxy-6-polyprenyl-1,4-benzoquinol methylase